MVYLTTGMSDSGKVDYSLESAMCKIYATEVCWRGINECMQMVGGLGYMKEYPAEKYMRDAKITQIYEGTNQIQRLVIARNLIRESASMTK